jgi:hypothetical protein
MSSGLIARDERNLTCHFATNPCLYTTTMSAIDPDILTTLEMIARAMPTQSHIINMIMVLYPQGESVILMARLAASSIRLDLSASQGKAFNVILQIVSVIGVPDGFVHCFYQVVNGFFASVNERDKMIDAKDKMIDAKDRVIDAKDIVINEKDKRLGDKDETIKMAMELSEKRRIDSHQKWGASTSASNISRFLSITRHHYACSSLETSGERETCRHSKHNH